MLLEGKTGRRPSIIVFYFEWENTSENHAGMAYFARQLKKELGLNIKLVRSPKNYGLWHYRIRQLWRKVIICRLVHNLKNKDVLLFMEYLGGRRPGDYREYALELRALGVQNRLMGIVHLPMRVLFELYDAEYIRRGLDALDDIIVFGSSLSQELAKFGYNNKVRRTFHYADTRYYRPDKSVAVSNRFNVITMGFLYRNRSILKAIIEQCPDITFHLCLGNSADLHDEFADYKNVVHHWFMPESDLLRTMQRANVSLSVFDETIGSNVIATSLACGLPQIVSDVGSIRDYCSEHNAVFCREVGDYVAALKRLRSEPQLRSKMGESARKRAEELSLEKSIDWFRQLIVSKQ